MIISPKNNSSEKSHYKCDGVNDSAIIQSAINEAGTVGSHIQFLPGIYNITSPITISNPWEMVIEGGGVNTKFYKFVFFLFF